MAEHRDATRRRRNSQDIIDRVMAEKNSRVSKDELQQGEATAKNATGRNRQDFAVDVRGQIVSAQLDGISNAVCVYEVVWGADWLHHNGSFSGETQLSRNKTISPTKPSAIWNFPIEISFKSTNAFGWPRIVLTVRDGARRIVGYGAVHIPSYSGTYVRYCKLFTPKSGSGVQAFIAAASGEYPEFYDPRFTTANSGREAARVNSSGVVKIEFLVSTFGMSQLGFEGVTTQ